MKENIWLFILERKQNYQKSIIFAKKKFEIVGEIIFGKVFEKLINKRTENLVKEFGSEFE